MGHMLGWDYRAARYTWTAALVLLALYIGYVIRDTLFVFVVSLLLAYLLYPLVDLLNHHLPHRSRTPALVLVYLALIGLLVTFGMVIGSQAADQATNLTQRAPEFLERMRAAAGTPAPGESRSVQQTVVNTLENYVYQHYDTFVSAIPQLTLRVLKASKNLIYVIIVPILSFFILRDGRTMRDELLSVVETAHSRALIDEILNDVHTLLLQYMRALFTLCLITLVTFAIFLSAIGAPYSILLACIAFPLEFIPLVGPLTAAVTIMSVTAITGYPHLLWVLVFLGAYRLCQDYVVSPRLMSSGVELHPLLVMVGVLAGGELAGVQGTFLSVPTLALLRVIYRRIRLARVSGHEPALVK